jgi:hypothetical protein
MGYVALLMPAMTLAALPLIDRLQRWALDQTVAPAEPAPPRIRRRGRRQPPIGHRIDSAAMHELADLDIR